MAHRKKRQRRARQDQSMPHQMPLPPANVICDYCQNPAEQVRGDKIYPHRPDLHHKQFYRCVPCGAYVGCHDNGSPYGRLANAELRMARQKAHAAFDPLWRNGAMARQRAYKWLSTVMGLPIELTHIGNFDLAQCAQVVEQVKKHKSKGWIE